MPANQLRGTTLASGACKRFVREQGADVFAPMAHKTSAKSHPYAQIAMTHDDPSADFHTFRAGHESVR
jgi:hypothetical protein